VSFLVVFQCYVRGPVIPSVRQTRSSRLNAMNDELKVSITSPPDREYLVAEIMLHNEQWAELNQERGYLSLLIYPRRDGLPWLIGYQAAVEALEKAKARLVGDLV